MKLKNLTALVVVGVVMLAASGCSTIDRLEANAAADRAAHPEKYEEIPAIARQQMSPGQNGAAYPEFCTWGCPEEATDLTRSW